jgi:hypothetical protein
MVKLITVATHTDGYLKWLKLACLRYKTDLTILGWNEKWKGYAWKFMLMMEYLKTIPDDELVCFIDAFDVLLLRPLTELEDYFNAIQKISNKKIIIACDRVKIQTIKIMADYIFDTCKDIAINTGTYLGRAKDIRYILENIMKHNMDESLDDQKILTEYCVTNPDVLY